jgi:peptide/nickel transport system permease protein
LLGLDFEGRDVLARFLHGGSSTLVLAVTATVLIYALGISFGLLAGYSRSIIDPLLMRTVDVLLSLPSLLVILLFITGLGSSRPVMVAAAAVVLFPGVARIVRSATLEVSTRGYVEAAVARGESTVATLRREVLPNILPPIVADMGLRFSWSIILIASVNFLGLGIRPPTPDWGLMISENLVILPSNPLAIVAPAAMIGLLIIAVNLISDGIMRVLSGGDR